MRLAAPPVKVPLCPFEGFIQSNEAGIYKVTSSKPLAPGEYCFVPPGGAVGFGYAGGQLFDFGIDGAQ